MPAERELAELIGVRCNTLRDALNKLEARGYIERRDRSGNYVCTAIPQALSAPLKDARRAGTSVVDAECGERAGEH